MGTRFRLAEMTMLMVVRSIALPLMIALIAAAPNLAVAQRVVGGTTRPPEVEVDLSVLDSLGPAPTLPDLLRGQPRASRSATASAGTSAAQQTAVHAPRHKKKSKATAHAGTKATRTVASAAERAAAPVKPVAANNATAARHSVTAAPIPEGVAPATPPSPPMPELPAPAAPPPVPTIPPAPAAATPPTAASPATTAAQPSNTAPVGAPPSAAAPTPAPPSTSPTSGEKVAAVAPPPAAAAPAPAAPPVTAAAAPSVVTAIGDKTVRVQFPAGATDLPEGAKRDLDGLAQKLASNEQARLQLVAYAAGGADEANQARRLSLSRALAVRTYLIAQGVPNSRMDVRALGNRSDGGAPPDRVDIVMLDR
jgi:outer membrane protein OmpA-like peptidoglycan-associated protein